MKTGHLVITLGLVALLAGCGSSPPSTFYALAPMRGAPQPGAPRVIEIRRPAVAGYLDRPEIVRRVVDYRLGVAATDRWGEPLDAMIGRVLALDLEQRAPGSSVYTEAGSITAPADAFVEVDLRRFEASDDGNVTLVAEVAVERAGERAPAVVRAVTLREAPPGGSTGALALTMSELLGQLSDQIAAMLRGS
jgi:uncharacterized lipoprotein YmbA